MLTELTNWIKRLPNGIIRLDLREFGLHLSDFTLKIIDNSNQSADTLIDFTSDISGKNNTSVPSVLESINCPKSNCCDLDFGIHRRGWFIFELVHKVNKDLYASSKLLVGDILSPNISFFHSENTSGPTNNFQISINDPDGFDDIIKVFIVISKTPKTIEGDIVGVDLVNHKFFEGVYADTKIISSDRRFSLLDTHCSNFESFSSIVHFNPKILFNELEDTLLYIFVGFEDKFLGIITEYKCEFTVSCHTNPIIKNITIDLNRETNICNFKASVLIKKARESISSIRFKIFTDSGHYCEFIYDIRAKAGRIIRTTGDQFLDYNNEIINFQFDYLLEDCTSLTVKFPYPLNAEYIQTQLAVVSIQGKRSDFEWSGPLHKSSNRLFDYKPNIESHKSYLRKANLSFPANNIFSNSDIVLMRAYSPLVKPKFMDAADYRERFNDKLYTPYPYRQYPIDYTLWNYSSNLKEQLRWVPKVSFSIDTCTLNLSAFPILKNEELNAIAALDFDLHPNVIPPWMRKFPFNRELLSATRKPYLQRLRKGLEHALEIGASSIQLDGFPNGGIIVTMGGDFSDDSMRMFTNWLNDNLNLEERSKFDLPKDLRDFCYHRWLKETKRISSKGEYMEKLESLPTTKLFREFNWSVALSIYKYVRSYLDKISPDRYIPITANGAPDWVEPSAYVYNSAIVDALVAEVHFHPKSNPLSVNSIYAYKMADALGVQLASTPKGEENDFFADNSQIAQTLLPVFIAESYAMGHRLMVPWSYWRKSTLERLYPDPENFKRYYEFISNHRELFDGFRRIITTGIVLRYGTKSYKTKTIIKELLENDVPFTLLIADGSRFPRHLSDRQLESVQRIILVDPINWYDLEDQLKLMRYQHKFEFDKPLAPIFTNRNNIYTTVWVNPATDDQIVHLLNRNYDQETNILYPIINFEVTIARNFWESFSIEPTYYSPNCNSVKLSISERNDNFVVRIPKLAVWGILVFRHLV